MNRVYIKTYGCQMNERDSEAVSSKLRARGYSIVYDEKTADIVLLNTCSVRDQAEQKAIGKAGYLASRKKKNPNFVFGIMGCMAQNHGEDLLDRLPDLDLIVGTQKIHRIPDHLDNLASTITGLGPSPQTVIDLGDEQDSQNEIREHTPDQLKVSAFVSIMQGCNMNCAFCIVPKTRGEERYRPIEHIVAEVEELVSTGTREVTLLGQIVNAYGRGQIPYSKGKSPFVQLLEAIHEVNSLERIRFTSPHPVGYGKDLVNAYRELPKLCEYAHLPVQSGSNRILKAMNRPYTKEKFLRIVDSLRESVPDIHLSTDIIVGFPGETENDFEQTKTLFEDVGFEMAFIFKYSIRTGTKAADMADQIPRDTKEARNQGLLRILEKSSLLRNESLVGTSQQVLVEGPARKGEGKYIGRTRGFCKVIFPGSKRMVGQLLDVKIEEATVTVLHGIPVLTEQTLEELSSVN
ncbi:MAG: tRNA (N6-isopentenyl adenosine(37)-C2)-methylthiotransferase MiaB [Verrucomicrobia bacterium]|nr:tRNA (N6-isopentenyl adenosine(37)-C2)-methylthiotransferase MiaB [Verrucomicrobiota bacterium]MDA0723898.1 tRNA (N6-isopentenyl adenosine(37)-C2)-methylthiotransferase MiaB [Verrucomicrobiota bacterium]MDA1045384.1 tRNA (N6-isopentenyl adenosine(37)-C2)-methylthiotransferase MiaB [Verrucomicrobiota bacterium]